MRLAYLSADIICSEKRTVFRERSSRKTACELRGTENVQGQISGHILAPNGGYCLYYLQIFFATRLGLKIGEYLTIIPLALVGYEMIDSQRGA